jgi:hypothetical protein
MSNVRKYTDEQLVSRFKSMKNFKGIPKGKYLILVRSTEDATDLFDDKSYLMEGEKCLMVQPCTTNKGLKGTAVMLADHINYDAHKFGLHRGKMRALRQVKNVPYQRDLDKDGKTDETGVIYNDIIYMNIHGATYVKGANTISKKIGGWSEGCLVHNDNDLYEKMIVLLEKQEAVTSVVLREWEV